MNTAELIKAVKEEDCPVVIGEDDYCMECTYGTHNNEVIEKLQRLAELEDKLDSGTLVELPCKIGDTIYWIDVFGFINEEQVTSISIEPDGVKIYVSHDEYCGYFPRPYFGVSCFTDKAQAEAKLKKLQENR